MKNAALISVSLLAFAVAAAAPQIAHAQNDTSEDSSTFETVVVTATKREESAQTVPISLYAFPAEELERKNIEGVDGIELFTPGFTFDTLGAISIRPAIRGIGNDEPGPGGDFATAVFLDGIYLATPGMSTIDLFDINRVEVLKGPQGTLFGKNVVGGMIDIIPNKPVYEFEAMVSGTGATFGQLDFEGMVNTPLSKNWATRAAFVRRKNEGFADNITTGNNLEDIDRFATRLSLLGQLGEQLTVDLMLDYTTDDSNGRNNQIVGATPGAGRAPVWELLAADIDDIREESDEGDDFAEREMFGARLQFDYDLGFATLTSISSHRDLVDDQIDGDDGHTFEQLRIAADTVDNRSADYGFGNGNDVSTFSTELRLAGTTGVVDWLIGGYYSREDYVSTAQFPITTFDCRNRASNPGFTVGLVEGVNGCVQTDFFDRWDLTNVTDSYAVFADAAFNVTDKFTVSGGIRYTKDNKEFTNTNARSLEDGFTAIAVASEIFDIAVEDDFDDVTYRGALEYSVTDDVFLYGLYSTGYKSGSYATFTANAEVAATPLDLETSQNAEVGVKADWLNGLARTNVTLFRQEFEGLQTVTFSEQFGAQATNAADATILGVEVEGAFALTDKLIFDAAYTFLDSEVNGIEVRGSIFNGVKLQRAPEHDITTSLTYTHEVGSHGSVHFGTVYTYRSKVFDDPDNNEGEIRPSRDLLNLYVSWENDDWSAKLWANNVLDEEYFNRISDAFGAIAVTLGPPRQVGVTLTKRFN